MSETSWLKKALNMRGSRVKAKKWPKDVKLKALPIAEVEQIVKLKHMASKKEMTGSDDKILYGKREYVRKSMENWRLQISGYM